MREHGIYFKGEQVLRVPCEDCYSVESFWHRIPYEPDSRTTVDLTRYEGESGVYFHGATNAT